jgi:hypothetical protein
LLGHAFKLATAVSHGNPAERIRPRWLPRISRSKLNEFRSVTGGATDRYSALRSHYAWGDSQFFKVRIANRNTTRRAGGKREA